MNTRTIFFAFCLSVGFAFASCPPRIEASELMNPLFRSFVFERVWQTVSDNYVYEDFNGLDWSELKNSYRNSILEVKDNAAFYAKIDEMIFALNDDHSIYLAPWETCAEDGWLDPTPSPNTDLTQPDSDLVVKRLEQNPEVLLVTLTSFDSELTDERFTLAIKNALREGDLKGIIFDLRHNYGGYLDTTFNILENFVQGKMGFEVDKTGQHPIYSVRSPYYRKLEQLQIIVFVDEESHSAAELTAGILQLERGAIVMGSSSAGNTEIVTPFDFRDGSRLWLAVSSFRLRDGTNLEGRGVLPDIPLKPDDDFIAKALEVLDQKKLAGNSQ